MITAEVSYRVKTEVFEGPFDLLLKAIDDGQVDIFRVSLAQITAAYIDYWRQQAPSLVTAGDFLYLAAYLIEQKTRGLLPAREELTAEAEETAVLEDSLLAHIQEYQLFKQVALGLKERKDVFARIYSRHEGEPVDREIDLVDISLRDLVVAFQKVYREAAQREKIVEIVAEEVSLEERIAEIKRLVADRADGLPFIELFIRQTRLEVVVTFLGILELAKQRFIRITQDRRFGTILVFARLDVETVMEVSASGTEPSETGN
ncbi:MAG: segregation/condensation protein A [Candidatus Margulisiibacteriota bacterium]